MESEVSVAAPPDQMFRLWRNVENLPALVSHLDSVERQEGRRSRWTVRGAGAPPLAWDVEADDEVENERLGWHSVPGAPVDSAASISFVPADEGASTRVRVEVSYTATHDESSLDVERALGPRRLQGLADDLARMKRSIEAGETIVKDKVEEASVDSFPASDPPAWTTGKR